MAADSPSNPQSQANGILAYGQRQFDRVVAPPTRQKAYDATTAFASDKPILSAFIVSQILFSFLPLVLFVSFALSIAVFAFVSAVIFSLFWIGVAMLVLVPALFVAFSVAVLVWTWAVATIVVGRWAYNALPVHSRGEMAVKTPNGKKVIFHKDKQVDGDRGLEYDNFDVKSEAAEIKE